VPESYNLIFGEPLVCTCAIYYLPFLAVGNVFNPYSPLKFLVFKSGGWRMPGAL